MAVDLTAYNAEQTIKKQITIAAGATDFVRIAIPTGVKAAVKGYGYTWYTSNTFQLNTGQITLPTRTDQEGSASIPRIFGMPLPCREGGNVEFKIINGDSSDHTYDVVIYLLTSQLLDIASTGGELVINTATGSGTPNNVVIYNSGLTTAANVTAKGLAVDPQAPATLNDGTLTTSGATAVALAATTALKKGVLVQAPSTNTANVLVGSSGSQSIVLTPGDTEYIEIDDIAKVYVKRASATNVTVNYHAT